jgi:hypothetical protein
MMTPPVDTILGEPAMSTWDTLQLAFSCLLLIVFLTLVVVTRQVWRTLLNNHWPTTTATIARDFVGSVGRGGTGSFFHYNVNVGNKPFSGRFVVIDAAEHAEMLQAKLDSLPIAIKYNPKSPKIPCSSTFTIPVSTTPSPRRILIGLSAPAQKILSWR